MASIDRISALPDGVLCHILSFLPTNNSMSTSILAKRWRSLWAHVPTLDFDIEDHYSETRFSSLIHRVMLRHKLQRLNTFRLYCNGDYDFGEYELETWIIIAIEWKVQNLDFHLDYEIMLPECIFTSKNLVDLRLKYCTGIPSFITVSLPSLKKLHLDSVEYENDEDFRDLLSGCSVLDELIIKGTMGPSLYCCDISSPTIKRLTIDVPFDGSEFDDPDYRVKINASALIYLEVHDISYEHMLFSPTTSLIEAHVRLNHYKSTVDKYTRSVLMFLDSLCNVKCLRILGTLYDKKAQDLDLSVACSIAKFDNLTKLEFGADWRFLNIFLQSAHHLQVLIFCEVIDSYLKFWMEPDQVPKCLLSHLRSVRIDHFGCTEQEFELIRYLLRNAKLLERMEIFSQHEGTDLKAEFDSLKRISLFKRGSEACKLVFH